MASYNGNIDLLSLNGAKLFKGIDAKNPNALFVCIPVGLNEIKVDQVPQNEWQPEHTVARLHVNIWPISEDRKAKSRQRQLERGGDLSKIFVATHEMIASFSDEFIKGMIDRYPKLVEDVREKIKERQPDVVNQDPKDTNLYLFKAIRGRMNKHLAQLFQPKVVMQQAAPQPSAYSQARNAVGYTPTEQTNDPFAGYEGNADDLPF